MFALEDHDPTIIARSSRVLEPFLYEAVNLVVPKQGSLRLLEIGCGSGVYIKHALDRNPDLTAMGVELQDSVVEATRKNFQDWGINERAAVEAGDIRERQPEEKFDIATLHNNIYYFPVDERVKLLRHVSRFIKPGGILLLTTICRRGGIIGEIVNLFMSITEGCGRLPDLEELIEQLQEAGFETKPPVRLVPNETHFAFVGKLK